VNAQKNKIFLGQYVLIQYVLFLVFLIVRTLSRYLQYVQSFHRNGFSSRLLCKISIPGIASPFASTLLQQFSLFFILSPSAVWVFYLFVIDKSNLTAYNG
jgi:hypothetical protein